MEPISTAQHGAATTGRMPEVELIDEGLWSVPTEMPGDYLGYMLSVVHVDDRGDVTVIDPGWGADGAIDRFGAFLTSIGRRLDDVGQIIVTHAHPDHIGLAAELREVSGAQIVLGVDEHASAQETTRRDSPYAPQPDRWGVAPGRLESLKSQFEQALSGALAPPTPDVLVDDGDMLAVRGARWQVVHTPGHTRGHVCIVDHDRRLLISGDHILPMIFPGLGLGPTMGSNPVADYLHSVRILHRYDEHQVVPGHGYRFMGLRERRRDAARHVLRRAEEIAAALAIDPEASTWDLASRVSWSGGWDRLAASPLLFSGLMQTDNYREFIEAGGLDSPDAIVA